MKVNKKALYALAAYYSHCDSCFLCSKEERNQLAHFVEPCILEPFNEQELFNSFARAEIFFKITLGDIYDNERALSVKFNDANIAKLLRYIAKNGKFPKHRSLRYV